MATKTTAPEAYYASDDIVIERREEIGRVKFDPSGTGHPIEVSFEMMARYLAENANENRINLSFRYGEHEWSASVEPVKPTETVGNSKGQDKRNGLDDSLSAY